MVKYEYDDAKYNTYDQAVEALKESLSFDTVVDCFADFVCENRAWGMIFENLSEEIKKQVFEYAVERCLHNIYEIEEPDEEEDE